LAGPIREVNNELQAVELAPVIPLRPQVKRSCPCGGPLSAAADFIVCEHCHRLYCPDCGGPIVDGGSCRSCAVCGYGYCA